MNIEIKERKSKFIHQFEHQAVDIICPTFHVFGWAHRCPFDQRCDYCYLNLTLRYEDNPIIYISNNVLNEVTQWLKNTDQPSVLNAGELCDSFIDSEGTLLATVMDLFEMQDKHKLLLLTKHSILPTAIERNVYMHPYNQTIFSFSINSREVSSLYEKGAPSPFDRIATAYTLKKQGQIIRIRIDPIIEIKNYQEEYQPLVNVLNDFLKPERITLGSLRFFKNLPNFAVDKDVFKHAEDQHDGDGRLRIPLEKRVEIYKWFIDNLKCEQIGLCKETLSCHRLLNFRKDFKCNCTL